VEICAVTAIRRPEGTAARGEFSGWVDAAGRVVERAEAGGIVVKRMAYELAFENWRIARDRAPTAGDNGSSRDILERTAISAGVAPGSSAPRYLVVRLDGINLRGRELRGGRQTLSRDTLRIRREVESDLAPSWSLLHNSQTIAARFRADLGEAPLLQVHDVRIVKQALQIAGPDRDPRVIAEKINRWVHDSVRNAATFSVPNAIEVLRTRRGDCNEHTQLAVALSRALGIPARIATGLLEIGGKFYYHTWPEVFLREWVAMDPTFGQFPADAAHLRFVVGGTARQPELLHVIGNGGIQVLESR
jgi:transglutaminase-like putative cysteine protease